MRVDDRQGGRRPWLRAGLALVVISLTIGCGGPKLDERRVRALESADQMARRPVAYERARGRLPRLARGMSVGEVERAMEAVIAIEGRGEKVAADAPRKKLIEGLLCAVRPSPQRQRWLFGYDEGDVVLIGFAVEFERDDVESEKWSVRSVDRRPEDDCMEPGGGFGSARTPGA